MSTNKLSTIEDSTKKVANIQEVKEMSPLAAINSMDPLLRKVYDAEVEAYREFRGDYVMFNYARGKVASEILDNPKHGAGAIEKLSIALSVDKSTMYKTVVFNSMYEENDLKEVLHKAKSNEFNLTWSHFAAAVHVPCSTKPGQDPHEGRKEVIDFAIEKQLSVRDLTEHIKDNFGAAADRGKPIPEARVNNSVRKLNSSFKRFNNKSMSDFKFLEENFHEVVSKSEDLEGIKESLASLFTDMSVLRENLKNWVEYMESIPAQLEKEKNARIADNANNNGVTIIAVKPQAKSERSNA